ncbi:type IV toxin-antitoxin system AbiEi family antitoxin domain-containing protein [Gordonibacter sp.]|uniref:type IV toxin-antitoxin system AbiEi family antitoxin domain-containing protein n=1 Tax=Gordonibacter sp. TaxID=1968902 RepID=UPI002FCB648E
MNETMTDMERLREVALDQHGYVTASQAQEAGVSRPSLSYLAKRGRVERACRGVYRVSQVPYTEYDAKHLALLWADPEAATLGYDTALDAYGVCDVNPMKVHVVVGKGKRISRSGGNAYVVHKEDLSPEDLSWWEGMRMVRFPVALRQCLEAGLPTYLVEQALEGGRAPGLLSAQQAGGMGGRREARK